MHATNGDQLVSCDRNAAGQYNYVEFNRTAIARSSKDPLLMEPKTKAIWDELEKKFPYEAGYDMESTPGLVLRFHVYLWETVRHRPSFFLSVGEFYNETRMKETFRRAHYGGWDRDEND